MTSKTKPLTTTEKLRTPPYLHMIKGAIAGLKERKGSTKPRILKYIFDNYGIKNSSSANRCLDQALKTNVENGEVEEIKSTGSNLLFKLNIQAINKRSVAIAKASTIKTDQVVKSGNVSDSSSIKKSKATNAKNGTARKFAIAQNASKRKKETASHSIERRSPRTLRNRLNTSQTRITISQKEKSKRRTKQPVIKKTTATNAKRGTARKCTIAKNASKRKKETVLHSIERKSSRTQSRRLNTSQTRITVSQEERSKSTTKQPGIKKTTATNAKKETTLHSIEGKSIRPQSRKPNTSQTMITISQEVKSKIATKQPVRYEEATFRNVTEVVKPSDSAGEIDMPSSSERFSRLPDIKITRKFPLDIRLFDDECNCQVRGLCSTPDGRILVADCNNKKIKLFDQNGLYLAAYAFHSLQSDQIHISVVNNNAAIAHVYEQTGGRLYTFDITDNLFLVKENNPMWNGGFLLSISSFGDKIVKTGTTIGGTAVKLTDQRGEEYWSRSESNNGQYLFGLPQFSTCYLENNKLVIVIPDTMNNTITKLDGETGEILNIISDESPFGVAVDADRGFLYVCKRNITQVVVYTTHLDNPRILLTHADGLCSMPRYITFNSSNEQLLISSESFGVGNYLDCYQINYE